MFLASIYKRYSDICLFFQTCASHSDFWFNSNWGFTDWKIKNTLNSWACGLCFNNAGLRESQMAQKRKREISLHLNGLYLCHLLATGVPHSKSRLRGIRWCKGRSESSWQSLPFATLTIWETRPELLMKDVYILYFLGLNFLIYRIRKCNYLPKNVFIEMKEDNLYKAPHYPRVWYHVSV